MLEIGCFLEGSRETENPNLFLSLQEPSVSSRSVAWSFAEALKHSVRLVTHFGSCAQSFCAILGVHPKNLGPIWAQIQVLIFLLAYYGNEIAAQRSSRFSILLS